MSKVFLLIIIFKVLVLISLAYIASLVDMSCVCGSRVWTRDRRGRFCAVCGEPWGEQYGTKGETVSDSKLSLASRLLAESDGVRNDTRSEAPRP
jgi:hypothetical protein